MSNTLKNHQAQMGTIGKAILGVYLMILTALLVYFVFALWPSADTSASEEVTAMLFGRELTFSADVQLIAIVVIAAALGSNVHAATSFVDFTGNRRLYGNWVWWYILRLFIGVSLALIFYFVIRAGLLTVGNTSDDINKFGIAAVAGLVGMFSKQATDKLSELFDNLFKTEKPDERMDKLTNPVPEIINIDPPSVPAGTTGLTLKINGKDFIKESVVRLAGVDRITSFVSSKQLTVDVPDSEVAAPVKIEVTVFNPSPGGGESNSKEFDVQ